MLSEFLLSTILHDDLVDNWADLVDDTIGLGVFGYLGALVEKIATRENAPDVVGEVDLIPSVDFTETEAVCSTCTGASTVDGTIYGRHRASGAKSFRAALSTYVSITGVSKFGRFTKQSSIPKTL